MAKTELHLQEEAKMFQTATSTSKGEKSNNSLLLDLEASRRYISSLVSSYIPSYLVLAGERSAQIEDVTENAWIKLWSATSLTQVEIRSPRSYITLIAYSEAMDEIRRHKRKPTSSLPLDSDGELLQGKLLLTVEQSSPDPAAEYELKEFITEIIEAVVQLPFKQMYGIVCELKEKVGSIFPLTEMFRKHGIDISTITWPKDPKELQKLRSLVSVARKTLRKKFNRVARQNKRSNYTREEKKGGQCAPVIASASSSSH